MKSGFISFLLLFLVSCTVSNETACSEIKAAIAKVNGATLKPAKVSAAVEGEQRVRSLRVGSQLSVFKSEVVELLKAEAVLNHEELKLELIQRQAFEDQRTALRNKYQETMKEVCFNLPK